MQHEPYCASLAWLDAHDGPCRRESVALGDDRDLAWRQAVQTKACRSTVPRYRLWRGGSALDADKRTRQRRSCGIDDFHR
ncbi:MAG: hypothetical protein U0P30_00430 [Vicinamibacterales bacterium]